MRRFEALEREVKLLSLTVGSLDSRMPGLTRAVQEFGLETHSSTTDLVARVTKLEEQLAKIINRAA
jgi:hypothetical protein